MPVVGETKTIGGVTGQWDGTTWRQTHTPAPSSDENGVAPSGLSMLGSMLGVMGPVAGAAGSAIGSAAHELSSSVPKLVEMARHGGGLFGPMGSEGVGEAMAEPAMRMARDVGVNAAINHAPAALSKGLAAGGEALTKFGASAAGTAPAWKRGIAGVIADPLLHALGIPSGVAEAASIVAPPAARMAGPVATKIGEAMPSTVMEGLAAAAQRMRPGVPEPPIEVSPADVVAGTVDTAQGYKAGGMSHGQAGQRAGWPLGKSEEVPASYPAEEINPDLFEYQKDELAAGRARPGQSWEGVTDPRARPGFDGEMDAPVTDSAAFRGLQQAVRQSNQSPIENFYESDPQAKVGGEGRMTGQFTEGSGGLADVAAGNVRRYGAPELDARISGLASDATSPLDRLVQASARKSPVDMDNLLRQLGGRGAGR